MKRCLRGKWPLIQWNLTPVLEERRPYEHIQKKVHYVQWKHLHHVKPSRVFYDHINFVVINMSNAQTTTSHTTNTPPPRETFHFSLKACLTSVNDRPHTSCKISGIKVKAQIATVPRNLMHDLAVANIPASRSTTRSPGFETC